MWTLSLPVKPDLNIGLQGQNTYLMACRDARVMGQALAMHDACLRSVLHQYSGYEVNFMSLQL